MPNDIKLIIKLIIWEYLLLRTLKNHFYYKIIKMSPVLMFHNLNFLYNNQISNIILF